ncbi:MAG TPA: membrane protein insertase YidC, partial [Pseudomonadales bacterium]|nr:membrane protein insertase YidC [Pseudomonadales bacterium]
MDIKRIVLILALASVAYMLVVQWNKDYGTVAKSKQTTASSLQDQSMPALPSESATQEKSPSANDLPTVHEEKNVELVEETTPKTQNYIRVKTDTLDVLINPRGGDVEYTA